MKKLKAIIIILLVCSTVILATRISLETQAENQTKDSKLDCDVLISFDSAKDTLKSIRLNNINKAILCSDGKYVKQGSNCLHLCPKMDEDEKKGTQLPWEIYLYPTKAVYLDAEYVCIDVYNPSDKNIAAVLTFGSVFEEYTVEPGENTLWMYIDRARLEYSSEGQIKDFLLTFEGECKELYLDNFRCYYSEMDYEKYSNDFTQNIWYSFEREGDLANIIYHGTKVSNFSQPMFNISRDIRYIKSGSGSLKVDFRNTLGGIQDTRSFRVLDNQLGDLNQYLDKLDKYYIAFPIYNPNNFDISCKVTVFSNYNDETIDVTTTIPAGSWSDSDFVITLKRMKEAFSGSGFDILTVAFEFTGMPDGGSVYLDSIGVYSNE